MYSIYALIMQIITVFYMLYIIVFYMLYMYKQKWSSSIDKSSKGSNISRTTPFISNICHQLSLQILDGPPLLSINWDVVWSIASVKEKACIYQNLLLSDQAFHNSERNGNGITKAWPKSMLGIWIRNISLTSSNYDKCEIPGHGWVITYIHFVQSI